MSANGQEATARTLDRLEQLFRIGPGPHALRLGLAAAEDEAHRRVTEWMEAAGLRVTVDSVGNLFGHRPGQSPSLPAVWLGSHLDTVPQGGRFDGALGVLAALEAAASFGEEELERGVTVVAFRDEEGARFGRSCFGSRALCGQLEPGELDTADRDGVTVREALTQAGRPIDAVSEAGWLPAPPPRCFLELHVEQGPQLADQDATTGIVTAITGVLEYEVRLTGRKGHAGTTPMRGRRDALVSAAEFTHRLSAEVSASELGVATVGRLAVEPGAPNVIPNRVTLSADCRAADRAGLDRLDRLVRSLADEIGARHGVEIAVEQAWNSPPAEMDSELRDRLVAATREAELSPRTLPSGAGHDAAVVARARIPTGMLFARSLNGGVSHVPEEETDAGAIEDSIRILARFLERVARGEERADNPKEAAPDAAPERTSDAADRSG